MKELTISMLKRAIKRRVDRALWFVRYEFQHAVAIRDVNNRWNSRVSQYKHRLPDKLIVSLTSYPKRYDTLSLTLKCLLTQSLAPDQIILWIAEEEIEYLPDDVLSLAGEASFEIRSTSNIRSYKKIIPALKEWPCAFIVTADDDVHYGRDWLRQLVDAYSGSENQIICHRARYAGLDQHQMLDPYSSWPVDRSSGPDREILPTGIGGVLYSPGSLHAEALNERNFSALCPDGDDIWLAWMGRLAGARYRKLEYNHPFVTWKGSQETALWFDNVRSGRNDRQIRNLETIYGSLRAARIDKSENISQMPDHVGREGQ